MKHLPPPRSHLRKEANCKCQSLHSTTFIVAGTDFNIEATTGLVMLAAASLDYTTKPEYELVITATDGGTPQLSASITATVTVQTRKLIFPIGHTTPNKH